MKSTFPKANYPGSFIFPAAWVAGILAVSSLADDWPTYRGNDSRSGVTLENLKPPLKTSWVFRPHVPPQPAWPGPAKWDGWNKVYDLRPRMIFDRAYQVAAVGDSVYFGSSATDRVVCMDATNGSVRWSFFTEGPVRLAPTLVAGKVYFGSDDGLIYCLDSNTGVLIWKNRPSPRDYRVPGHGRMISVWPVRTGLVVRDGIVYGCAGMFPKEGVYLCALNAETGEQIWKSMLGDLPAQGYILASQDNLYVPTGRNNPTVFARADGRRLRTINGQGGTVCLLAGDSLIYGPGKTGEISLVEPGEKDRIATFPGNHMLVSEGMSYLHTDTDIGALDRARYLQLARSRRDLSSQQKKLTGEVKIKIKKNPNDPEIKNLRSEIIGLGSRISEMASEMKACALWKQDCDHPFSLILAGSVLYAGGENEIAAISVEDGRYLWTGKTEGKVFGMAVANGRLYASTDQGKIHCFIR